MNESTYEYSTLERANLMLLIIEWIYNAISLIQLCSIALQYTVTFTTRIANHINVAYAEKPRIVTNTLCVIIGAFNGASIFSCVITILNIALERLLATLLKNSYEMRSHGIGMLILLFTILLGISVSMAGFVYDIRMGYFDLWSSTESCFAVHLHPQIYPLAWITAAVCCFIGSLVIFRLYKYNKKQRKCLAGDTLSSRYQYNENMITTKALAPAISGYAFFCVPGLFLSGYTTYLMLRDGEHDAFVQLLLQILYMMADAYQMFFIIYVTHNYLPLKSVVKKDLQKLFRLSSSRVDEETRSHGCEAYKSDPELMTNTYFSELDKCWGIEKNKRKR
uniref:G-protein coupled receptors family 1 profile domain-containing protein n=2 Tax=Ditylenchus dipsaci TaxID=166011 RepID=A0A915DSV1_9BILA